jgi:hypothetical protein
MTTPRRLRWLLAATVLLLLNVFASGTAYAADPRGSLSERILGNQISGPYDIEVVGATFVDDAAFAITIDIDGLPAPAGTTAAFLLAPDTGEGRGGFGSAAAVTEFTPAQEQDARAATAEAPGSWVLNPAPLDQVGTWKGRLLVDGPAGPASAGFTFHVYPPRPALSAWLTLTQPVIPALVLGLALLIIRARRTALLRPSAAAETTPRVPS